MMIIEVLETDHKDMPVSIRVTPGNIGRSGLHQADDDMAWRGNYLEPNRRDELQATPIFGDIPHSIGAGSASR